MGQLWFNACGVARVLNYALAAAVFLATKIQFQQAINPVNTFMVPCIALPAQQLEQLLKTVARIAFCQFSQRVDLGFITPGIGLIKIHRPAQR